MFALVSNYFELLFNKNLNNFCLIVLLIYMIFRNLFDYKKQNMTSNEKYSLESKNVKNTEISQSVRIGDKFSNPWSTWKDFDTLTTLKYFMETNKSDVANEQVNC